MEAADQLGVQVIDIASTTYSAYIVPQSTRVYGDLVTGFASSAAAVPDGPSGAFTINTFDTDGVQMGTWISTAAIKGSVQTSPAATAMVVTRGAVPGQFVIQYTVGTAGTYPLSITMNGGAGAVDISASLRAGAFAAKAGPGRCFSPRHRHAL